MGNMYNYNRGNRTGMCPMMNRRAETAQPAKVQNGGKDTVEANSGNGQSCRDCRALLCKIQTLDFAIQEIVLYLDAYPHCCEALNFYRKLCHDRVAAVKMYEEVCGPLTSRGNDSACEWDWVRTPWPWQSDFYRQGSGTCDTCRKNG